MKRQHLAAAGIGALLAAGLAAPAHAAYPTFTETHCYDHDNGWGSNRFTTVCVDLTYRPRAAGPGVHIEGLRLRPGADESCTRRGHGYYNSRLTTAAADATRTRRLPARENTCSTFHDLETTHFDTNRVRVTVVATVRQPWRRDAPVRFTFSVCRNGGC